MSERVREPTTAFALLVDTTWPARCCRCHLFLNCRATCTPT